MPQAQLNACLSLTHQLPAIANQLSAIAKQLKIANQLKAFELKRAADPSLKASYEWIAEIDRIIAD